MLNKNLMTKKVKGQFSQFNEWQDHQYNPGYWINRFTPYFPPRRSKGFWIIALIDFFVIVPTFFVMSFIYLFVEQTNQLLGGTILLGVFSIIVILRAINLKPPEMGRTQEELDEIRRKENKERKICPRDQKIISKLTNTKVKVAAQRRANLTQRRCAPACVMIRRNSLAIHGAGRNHQAGYAKC